MLRKSILLLGMSVSLFGCATIYDSRPTTISPPSANGEKWSIRAASNSGWWTDKIVIYVNDTPVATGKVDAVNHETHFSEEYRHHIVSGNCIVGSDVSNADRLQCVIYVDGVKMTTLQLAG